MRRVFTVLILLLLLQLSGCYRASKYRGSGKISDSGFFSYPRYSIAVGTVDFGKIGTKEFELKGLPHSEMTLGFQITALESLAKQFDDNIKTLVKVELRDEFNRVVIDEEASLDKWVWSSNQMAGIKPFIYRRGGDWQNKNNIKPDKGWGTYFKPRTRSKYLLIIEIKETDPKIQGKFEVDVIIKGGGNELP